jgi:hypothetical protein
MDPGMVVDKLERGICKLQLAVVVRTAFDDPVGPGRAAAGTHSAERQRKQVF